MIAHGAHGAHGAVHRRGFPHARESSNLSSQMNDGKAAAGVSLLAMLLSVFFASSACDPLGALIIGHGGRVSLDFWGEGIRLARLLNGQATPSDLDSTTIAMMAVGTQTRAAPTLDDGRSIEQCGLCTLAALGGDGGGATGGGATASASTSADAGSSSQPAKKRKRGESSNELRCSSSYGIFASKHALGGHRHLRSSAGLCSDAPETQGICPPADEEELADDAAERSTVARDNIRRCYLVECSSLHLDHYVSTAGVQRAKEGFAKVAKLQCEAITDELVGRASEADFDSYIKPIMDCLLDLVRFERLNYPALQP